MKNAIRAALKTSPKLQPGIPDANRLVMPLVPIPALVAWLALAGGFPHSSAVPDGRLDDSTLRLRIVQDGRITNATCVLIHRDNRADGVVLYFVTASHLFKRTTGEAPSRVTAINVVVDGRHAITIDPDDLVLPVGSLVDIAILRAVVTHTTLVPQAILFEPPMSGSVFLIAGRDDAGTLVTLAERVRRRSTAVVVGDRDASALTGCEGAPAVGDAGVFGIVSQCEPGRLPLVTLFSIAHDWISRHVPGLFDRPSLTTQFSIIPRDVPGPLLAASCGEEISGDIDVPFELATDEMAVDATASFVDRTAVRLGEVTVLKLADNVVKLRFTLTGVPPPPLPTPCPAGQALVNVRMTVAKVRR